jgi:hypothetical protein
MNEKNNKIDKEWCICWIDAIPIAIGYIVEEKPEPEGIVKVKYSEEQRHEPALWNKKNIKRFQTITEMIEYIRLIDDSRLKNLLKNIDKKFPSKKEEIRKIFF